VNNLQVYSLLSATISSRFSFCYDTKSLPASTALVVLEIISFLYL
jgi:hypothetical protein